MSILPYRSVMVTGAGGFVGRYLIEALRRRLATDAVIRCFDRSGTTPVDLLDAKGVRRAVAMARPDLVLHLAAQSSVGQAAGASAITWRVNVEGTLNLAEAIAATAPEAVVAFASSSEVYGAAFNAGIVDERSPTLPLSVYARTKRAGEEVLRDVLAASNRLVIFRPTNHSGPGQDTRFVLAAFAHQIAAIEAGKQPPILKIGSLTAERDFLDVRDVVEAYLAVLALPDFVRDDLFNVASGETMAIAALLRMLLGMTDQEITLEEDPTRMRSSDVPRTLIDAGKLKIRTGWEPHYRIIDTATAVMRAARTTQGGALRL